MSINIDTSVKNQGQAPAIITGLDANKPNAGQIGRLYYATNTNIIYIDNGFIWVVFINGGAGSGTINVTSPFVPYASSTNNLVNSIIKQLAGKILINQPTDNGQPCFLQVTGGIYTENINVGDIFGDNSYLNIGPFSLQIYNNNDDQNLLINSQEVQINEGGGLNQTRLTFSELNFINLDILNQSNLNQTRLLIQNTDYGESATLNETSLTIQSGSTTSILNTRSLIYNPVLGKSAFYNYDSLRLTDTTSLNEIDILPSSITLKYNLQNYFQSNSTSTKIKILDLGLLSTIPTISINFSLSIDSKVNRGNITLNASLLPGAGLLCTLTYGTIYSTSPYTFVTETGNNNIPASYIIFSQSNSQCQIFFINRSTTSTIPSGQLKINYLTIF